MKHCPQCTTGFPDHAITCPTHGGALNEIRELKPGMVVHKTYRIVRKLGKGGMGIVYLADQTFMEEQRALKFLSAELCEDAAFTSRFRQEVRALRQVRHKNVVDCGDLEPAEDDSLFFAMEFVEGPDLRDFLAKAPRPFDVALALEITRGIAEGLGAAHAQGLVHRDIKPENILMAPAGDGWVPKIADFGIVASKESSNTRTRTGGTLLTMAYAAPEQWRGTRAAELDGRTDLYALGGVLYEMLTGRTAFEAESYEDWANQHKNTAPQAPGELRPELKQWCGLDELILRLLSKDRHSRPENVTTLLSFLDALRHLAPQVRQETAKEKTVIAPRHATAIDEDGPRGKQQEVKREFAAMVEEQQDAGTMTSEGPQPYRSRLGPLGRWVGIATITISVIAFVTVWLARVVPWEPKPSHENASLNLPAGSPQVAQPKSQGVTLKPSGGSVIPHDAKPQPTEGPKPSHEEPAVVPPAKPELVEPAKPSTPVPSATVPVKPTPAAPTAADLYAQGVALITQKRFAEAAPLFEGACAGGVIDACNRLGWFYYFGLGVTHDFSRAAAFYSKSCDAGNDVGCGALGNMYLEGQGVAKDYTKALALETRECNANFAEACDGLGMIYEKGSGVAPDPARAKQLYSKACDGGSAAGCSNLGTFYLPPRAATADPAKAKELFRKSCSMGFKTGCDWLRKTQ